MSEGRPYHHGNLRAELLRRAWDIIEREGVENLSLRALARELGVSHGASARHFKDKQALLDALAVTGFEQLNQILAEIYTTTEPFEARFKAAALAYVQFAVTHPRILRLMYATKHHPDASGALRKISCSTLQTLTTTIAAAQHSGEVQAGDPKHIALVAFANFHGVATLATDDLLEGMSWQDAAALAIQFAWQGIAPANREEK
ncbi:TetR/AcrR family transcriptional regulator [Deinococcus metallilatus]|uniref:AcrR family transcriptional regulator n=1 Tax=Deinococcus metallilatus TaxID=1211322 RepID=A0ABR6MYA1_9DEIO|nr:TetR/AcrR family transcriptional regulator [Deinococcus metallilatus]MBB5296938.1 AcrR family transcriptional regulator [Deinococcus metallilatus]